MLDREELGKRIKKVREARQLTLKAIEASAGISATHISEIERGKTSPTLGALLRIARALGKDPAYFVEDEELSDVSIVTAENRVSESLPGGVGTMSRLTTSIPGGRVQAQQIILMPGASHRWNPHEHDGDEAAIVLAGKLRVTVGDDSHDLSEGDSIHYSARLSHSYTNAAQTDSTTFLWFATRRNVD